MPCHEVFRHLQAIQNAEAHLVTGTQRSDHISLVLQQLVWQQVEFKLSVLVCKAFNNLPLP